MKNYILCADLHIRANNPVNRKDNYFKSACLKFRQIIQLCNKYDADLIVAGDFFDSVKVGHKVVNTILRYIKRLKGTVRVVAGQHDQVFHTKDLKGSPLFTLILSGKVMLLHNEDYHNDGTNNIYGCSYGVEPIKPETKNNNILVIHKSITPEEPPFFLTEAWSAEKALDTWENYFLIVCGDYHQPFMAEKWGNVLVNCGPMMRSSVDQMDIEPKVWLFDAENNQIKGIKLKVNPTKEVFSLDNIKDREDSAFSKELGELVDTLKNGNNSPNYRQNIDVLMKEGKVSKRTKDKVNSIMGSVLHE